MSSNSKNTKEEKRDNNGESGDQKVRDAEVK
jgi:hypothetical protein